MSGGTKMCPNGHVMDATWDRCPYCPDPGRMAPRAPVPPTRQHLRPLPPPQRDRDRPVGEAVPQALLEEHLRILVIARGGASGRG